jgi:hypothetical protein
MWHGNHRYDPADTTIEIGHIEFSEGGYMASGVKHRPRWFPKFVEAKTYLEGQP